MSEIAESLDDWLASLVHPAEQPREDKTSDVDAMVCSQIVVDCVLHRWFSAQTLYGKLERWEPGFQPHLHVSDLCESRYQGLMLWGDRNGHYFPCRENAVKALVRLRAGRHLDRVLDLLHLVSVELLVAAADQLPTRTEFRESQCPACGHRTSPIHPGGRYRRS